MTENQIKTSEFNRNFVVLASVGNFRRFFCRIANQQILTCSESLIETLLLETSVKYVQS